MVLELIQGSALVTPGIRIEDFVAPVSSLRC